MKIKNLLVLLLILTLVFALTLTSCKKDDENQEDPTQECAHEETEIRNKKAPSCTEEGYTGDTYCKKCGEKIATGEVIPKSPHINGEGKVLKEATCQEEGKIEYKCTVCGKVTTETIPKTDHDHVYKDMGDGTHRHTCKNCFDIDKNEPHTPKDQNGVHHDATCDEYGYTEYECKYCGAKYKVVHENEKPTEHTFGDWTVEVEATCNTKGIQSRVCSKCGAKETLEIPEDKNNHKHIQEIVVDSTCEKEGTIQRFCKDCGAELETIVIPKKPHVFTEEVADGSGYVKKTCKNCGLVVTRYDASTKTEVVVDKGKLTQDESFEVNLEHAEIMLPKALVNDIKTRTETELKFKADVLDSTTKKAILDKMTEAERKALGDGNIYNFDILLNNVSMTANNTTFVDKVTVTLPYTLKDGENPEGIVIWYVKDDGTVTSIPAVYNAETKTVTFETDHFSYYCVAYEITAKMNCDKGEHEWVVNDELSQRATCQQYGYTVYECKHCHARKIVDITEPTPHRYGEVIIPEVDCTHGAYSYRECQDCFHREQLEYIRPKDHKITKHATCTEPAICEICGEIVEPARGHNWSEWEVITLPTETTEGLNRRYCKVCGKVQEVKTTLNQEEITALNIENHDDIVQLILSKIFQNNSGELNFKLSIQGVDSAILNVKVCQENGKYTAYIEETVKGELSPRGTSVTLFYKEGRIYMIDLLDENGEKSSADIEFLLPVDIKTLKAFIDNFFTLMSPEFEAQLQKIADSINAIPKDKVVAINALFAKYGLPITVDTAKDAIEQIQNIYVYIMSKLGLKTDLPQGIIKVPTDAEIVAFLGEYITVEEKGGETIYKFSTAPLMRAVKDLSIWLEARLNSPVSDIIFELFGDKLKTLEGVTDMNTLALYIKTNYPGDTKLKVYVDKIITFIDETNVITAEQFLDFINNIIRKNITNSPEDFDIRNVLEQFSEITLNDVLVQITADENVTFEILLDNFVNALQNITLGELTIPGLPGADLTGIIGDFKQIMEVLNVDLTLDLHKMPDGTLVLGEFNFGVSVLQDPETPPVSIIAMSVIYKMNPDIKIKLDDAFATLPNKPKVEENAQGDLVIDFGKEVDLTVADFPAMKVPIGEALTKNIPLSNMYGVEIYTLKDEFISPNQILTAVKVGDKYYQILKTSRVYVPKNFAKVDDVFENIEAYLPDVNNTKRFGYFKDAEGAQVNIYESLIGRVYKQNDVWYIVNDPDSSFRFEKGERVYISVSSEPVSEIAKSNIKFMTTDYADMKYKIKDLGIYAAYYGFINTPANSYTVKLAKVGSDLYFVDTELNTEMTVIDLLGPELDAENIKFTLDEYADCYIVENGTYKNCEAYSYYPETDPHDYNFIRFGNRYFACISDGNNLVVPGIVKAPLDTIRNDVQILPTGETMVVISREPYNELNGNYDLFAGYVELEEGIYTKAVAVYDGNKFKDLIYPENSYNVAFGMYSVYSPKFDVSDFENAGNGKYILPNSIYKLVKEYCHDFGTSLSVGIEEKDKNLISIYCIYTPDFELPEVTLDEIKAMIKGTSPELHINWVYLFAGVEDISCVPILKDDGTLDLIINSGYAQKRIEGELTESELIYEPEISEQLQVPIYTAEIIGNALRNVVLKDGKLYEYKTEPVTIYEIEKDSTDFRQFAHVSDVNIVDKTSSHGAAFYKADYLGVTIYLYLDKNTFYYLENGKEENGTVTFTNKVKLEEFIDKVNSTVKFVSEKYIGNTFYGLNPVYQGIAEFTVDGKTVTTKFEYTKDENGVKHFIKYRNKFTQSRFILLDEVELKDNEILGKQFITPAINGPFTEVEIWSKYNVYVTRIGDKFYRIDIRNDGKNYYIIHNFDFVDSDTVFDEICTLEEGYLMKDENRNLKEVRLVEALPDGGYRVEYTGNTVIGNDISMHEYARDNGNRIIYKYTKRIHDYQKKTLSDGRICIYKEGKGDFIKITGDWYFQVPAGIITNPDGSYTVGEGYHNCPIQQQDIAKNFAYVRNIETDSLDWSTLLTIDKEIVDKMKANPTFAIVLMVQTRQGTATIIVDSKLIARATDLFQSSAPMLP